MPEKSNGDALEGGPKRFTIRDWIPLIDAKDGDTLAISYGKDESTEGVCEVRYGIVGKNKKRRIVGLIVRSEKDGEVVLHPKQKITSMKIIARAEHGNPDSGNIV